jgi:hypothetical protein
VTETPDPTQPVTPAAPQSGEAPPPAPPATTSYEAAPAYAAAPPQAGPVGKIRSTGTCILLAIVTFGIYGLVWYYKTHEEMKQHTGRGLGGVVALLIAIIVGIASPFISSNEVGDLYAHSGKEKPVSAATGLWYFPGVFILIGPIVWFVKTNGALNEYWKSQGATA